MDERRLKQRQCLLCREKADKEQMLRLVVDESGQIWPDLLQKAPGRGAYICMRPACYAAMTDKRLGALRRNFSLALPQCNALKQRIAGTLRQQLLRILTQSRAVSVVGRDAVMHQMWKNGPLLLFLAADAGEALLRQIRDAADKRRVSGNETLLCEGVESSLLAEAFAREKISVVAVESAAASANLGRFLLWYTQLPAEMD